MSSKAPEPMPAARPIDYGTPMPRRPVIDVGLLVTWVGFAFVFTAVMLVVVPRFETTFRDYGTRLPLATILLLKFSRLCAGGGIVLVWGLCLAPAFLAPQLGPWPVEAKRRAVRPSRLITTLLMGLVVGWVVVSLFMPLATLMTTVSEGGGAK